MRSQGKLGGTVIIHLGNNGHFTGAQFERILQVLRGVPRIVFVNVKVPRRWQSAVNGVLKAGKRRHQHVVLVNWYHLWRTCHGRVFVGDGTHLTKPGARCYAKILAQAAAPPRPPTPAASVPPAPVAPVPVVPAPVAPPPTPSALAARV